MPAVQFEPVRILRKPAVAERVGLGKSTGARHASPILSEGVMIAPFQSSLAAEAETTMDVPNQIDVEDFTKWATSPAAWFSHAEQLRRSSELLWLSIAPLFATSPANAGRHDGVEPDQRGLHAPAYLLIAGFAIESMLKAAAIQSELNAKGPSGVIVAGPPPTLQPWLKTHSLEKLADRIGIAFQGESLTYLQRFEKYVLWAGRYPVPLALPKPGEPRGFDYQCGVQDHTRFQELYDAARDAYEKARQAQSAWAEPTSVGDYRQRESEWMATCTKWLNVVRPVLIEHGLRMANGDRGVLRVNIDTTQMEEHLRPPKAFVRLNPAWLPSDEFISIVGGHTGVGLEAARRWTDQLAVMDAARDVSLFLHSTPDTDGRWFSRFIFLQGGRDGTD